MVKGLDTFREYFLDETDINDSLLRDLKLYGVKANEIKDRLRAVYLT